MTAAEKTLTLTLGKTDVHYWEDGAANGRVLLLLHSELGDAQANWSKVIPLLSDDYRILAPDLPGFGGTALLPNMHTETILDWIKNFLDELDIEQAVIIGNSFGGLFARLFAASQPHYVPAVILVNGGTLPDIPGIVAAIARLPVIGRFLFSLIARSASSAGALKRTFYVQDALSESFVRSAQTNSSSFVRLMRITAAYPLPEKHNPRVPTLLLWGANDTVSTLDEANRIKDLLPGSKLVEIETCGHFPQLEAPEVFAWQIKQYLKELTQPPRLKGAGKLPQKSS